MSKHYDDFIREAEAFSLEQSNITTTTEVEIAASHLKEFIENLYREIESASLEHADHLAEKISETKILFDQFKNSTKKIDTKDKIDTASATNFIKLTDQLILEMDVNILKLKAVKRPDLKDLTEKILKNLNTHPNLTLAIQEAVAQLIYLDNQKELIHPNEEKAIDEIQNYITMIALSIENARKNTPSEEQLPQDKVFSETQAISPVKIKKIELTNINNVKSALSTAIGQRKAEIKQSQPESATPLSLHVSQPLSEEHKNVTVPEEKRSLNISEFKKFGKKTDGKNKDSANGVYQSSSGEKYFVKKPDDPREFFTELFAGLVITGLLDKNFIPEAYRDSVIPAKEVLMADGTYGLIQPFREFTPMHMVLGNNKGNQKFVLAEVVKKSMKGKGYEDIVQDNTILRGLSYALMVKFILADYSIHDGNIGIVESTITAEDKSTKKLLSFVAFDFGAALRAISSTENSANIYTSLEEKDRLFNFYKEYPRLYSNMPELFDKIKKHANEFKQDITNRAAEFHRLIKDATEKAFLCFKKNFSHDDPKIWEKNRNNLIGYIYKNDPNLSSLMALDDIDLPIKLGTNMFKFLTGRAAKLAVAAAPTPLNQERIKRYQSIGDTADMAHIAQQSQNSTASSTATSSTAMISQLLPKPPGRSPLAIAVEDTDNEDIATPKEEGTALDRELKKQTIKLDENAQESNKDEVQPVASPSLRIGK